MFTYCSLNFIFDTTRVIALQESGRLHAQGFWNFVRVRSQSLGLEHAGFSHVGLFENDPHACQTLRLNRPRWPVHEHDLFKEFDFAQFHGIDLLAGGLPCPPFSIAGKQLGEKDERNLFTRGVEIAEIVQPRAIMFENVRGMLAPAFNHYPHPH